jgi:hypothetical protein
MVHRHPQEPAVISNHQPDMSHPHRASTAVSLAMRAANILAQAEDLILLNGQNAFANAPLFRGAVPLVQVLDPNIRQNLDLGLLNIRPDGIITLPATQVIPVHPTVRAAGGSPPRYAENSLNAVAQGFSVLQQLGHYEHYALTLNTVPYADLHSALPNTLIEPVEPVSHLIKAGIYGTGTLPPFTTTPGQPTGLPGQILGANGNPQPLTTIPGIGENQNVLYTGGYCWRTPINDISIT